MSAGRFAPSPSGDMHIGNLRTAALAWVWARRSSRRFVLRIEDIDRVREGAAARQVEHLKLLGLDWDGEVLMQSSRRFAHLQALSKLRASGHLFECFCSRREIAAATRAPHTPAGFYPGTCRDLSSSERAQARARLAALGRAPAWRLLPDVDSWAVVDDLHGEVVEPIDCVVLQRGDGAVAYNLAVVVDDAFQGVDQVVRGDDLLFTAPTQAYLASLLGLPAPSYVHVPLVLNAEGARLAKRDGAVTLPQLLDAGWSLEKVWSVLAASVGAGEDVADAAGFAAVFDPATMPREPWVFTPPSA
ncbi:MAG: tRNA glutamyl-Q(34) synthetase GluQRS [Actinomycetaceae bacterium]|nr:tRNA glutamyl-Q(34) synthetase GluQRS [Actinomycetaceae bacterium]